MASESAPTTTTRLRPKNLKRLAIPLVIFIWTVASLNYESQWDLNILFRYYGWVFTAQVAFLIFFLPRIHWSQLKAHKSLFSNSFWK